jgi:hypothetical protein
MISLIRRIVQRLSSDFEIEFLRKKDFVPNMDYFSNVYKKQLFGRSESASGPGSSIVAAARVVAELPILLAKFSIKSIADVPCGDLNWLQNIDLEGINYSGYDIVPELVNLLADKYPSYRFSVLDASLEVLPKNDLIICRDLFVHLTIKQSCSTLKNFQESGSRYLLATTFTTIEKNEELVIPKIGVGWRPLNLEIAPFNLGKPIALINEDSKERRGKYSDKSLGLWKIN